MIANPKTCWQYCIQTEHLREPAESWELLQYIIHHPHKTLKECTEDKGIDYKKARDWSYKYFYNSRVQAYTRDMNKRLNTAVTNYKLKQIAEEDKRSGGENAVLNNELYFLQQEMSKQVQLHKDGETIPEYLENRVAMKEKQYFLNKLNKSRADKLVYDIANEPAPLDDIEHLVEEAPGVKSFLKAMQGNRDAHHDE